MKIYTLEQIRDIESHAKQSLPSPSLMERAGFAAARKFVNIFFDSVSSNLSVVIFAGPGDNGGDAFEMAYHLCQLNQHHRAKGNEKQFEISIVGNIDATSYSSDALASLARAQTCKITWLSIEDDLNHLLAHCDAIVDGIFGIGISRPITGVWAEAISAMNHCRSTRHIPVFALDVPSGLQADTGHILDGGNNKHYPVAARASHTISFIGDKLGLHTGFGRDYAGHVLIDSLGIDATDFPKANIAHNEVTQVLKHLQQRDHASHKGSYGDVAIIGGSEGMRGAAILAARAALYSGAGKVHIGFIDIEAKTDMSVDLLHPEIMCRAAQDLEFNTACIAIGPGLGQTLQAKGHVLQALQQAQQLVIDADALNLIASDQALQVEVSKRIQRRQQTIITPHPLEAARLLKSTAAEVQADRLQAAKQLAEKLKVIVLLKGSGSLITDGNFTYVNTTGNPGLASGGTGDVLSGVCAALCAQGLQAFDAARLASFVHGAAADELVQQGIGPIGMCASELPAAIREQLNSKSDE